MVPTAILVLWLLVRRRWAIRYALAYMIAMSFVRAVVFTSGLPFLATEALLLVLGVMTVAWLSSSGRDAGMQRAPRQ